MPIPETSNVRATQMQPLKNPVHGRHDEIGGIGSSHPESAAPY